MSAEIINAFFALDKGNNHTIEIVLLQLDETEKSLDDLLADTSKVRFRPIAPAVDEVKRYLNPLSIMSINSGLN